MEDEFEGIKNKHVTASLDNGKLVFLHKIKDGATDKSYGVHVAALASMPEEVIDRANVILSGYENRGAGERKQTISQIAFDLDKKDELRDALKEIDPLKLTPIDALIKLNELKELAKK